MQIEAAVPLHSRKLVRVGLERDNASPPPEQPTCKHPGLTDMSSHIETDQVFAGSAQEAISKTFHLDCFVVGIHDVEIDRPAATREVTDGRSNRDVANPKLGMHAPDEIVVSAHHAGGNPTAIVQRNL